MNSFLLKAEYINISFFYNMGCGISKTHENEELEELQLSET